MCECEPAVCTVNICATYPDSTILSSELMMSCIVVSMPARVRVLVTLSP